MTWATLDRALAGRASVLSLCLLTLPQAAWAICTPTAISQAEVASAGARADLVVIGRLEVISGTTEVSEGGRRGSGKARVVVEEIAAGRVQPGEELVFPYTYETKDFCTVGFDPTFGNARSAVYLKRTNGAFQVLLGLPMDGEAHE